MIIKLLIYNFSCIYNAIICVLELHSQIQLNDVCKLANLIYLDFCTCLAFKKSFNESCDNSLLSKTQRGFLLKKNLRLLVYKNVLMTGSCVVNKKLQSVVYIDFSKTFDIVSRPKLVAKLESLCYPATYFLLLEIFSNWS